MKKPVIIGVSALTLLAVSATLFAQTTTGSSLITEMKAAIRPFTLAGQLNPGVTDLNSSPVSGKKTGDMLTAGEYNRILELVGQGGGVGGKFEITNATTKTNYYLTWAARWMSSPSNYVVAACTTGFTQCATLDTAAHDFCMISAVAGGEPHTALRYLGDKKYQLSVTSSAGGSSSLSVVCYDNIGTGGGGTGGGSGGSGWVDVSSTTTPFDLNCEYKWKIPNFRSTGNAEVFSASRINLTDISVDFSAGNYQAVSASNKRSSTGDHGTFAAQTFQRCDGVGGGTTPPPAAPVTQAISVTTAADYNVSATVSCPNGYRLDASTITDSAPFNLGTPLGSGRVTLSGQGLICKSFMVGGGHGGTWTANTCSATCNK